MQFRSRVGERGQAVIPKPIRDALGIKPHGDIIFEMKDNRVVLEAQPDVVAQFEALARKINKKFKNVDMDAIYEEMLERR